MRDVIMSVTALRPGIRFMALAGSVGGNVSGRAVDSVGGALVVVIGTASMPAAVAMYVVVGVSIGLSVGNWVRSRAEIHADVHHLVGWELGLAETGISVRLEFGFVEGLDSGMSAVGGFGTGIVSTNSLVGAVVMAGMSSKARFVGVIVGCSMSKSPIAGVGGSVVDKIVGGKVSKSPMDVTVGSCDGTELGSTVSASVGGMVSVGVPLPLVGASVTRVGDKLGKDIMVGNCEGTELGRDVSISVGGRVSCATVGEEVTVGAASL